MLSKVLKIVGLVAGIITIIQFGFGIYNYFKDTPIPLWLYISSVVTSSLAGLFIGRCFNRKSKQDGRVTKPDGTEAFKEIGRVTFDYLPEPPVKNGWLLSVEGVARVPPEFSSAQDSPVAGGLKIIKKDRYALDYPIKQIQTLTNMVELYAKLGHEACFYLKVKLSSRDGSRLSEGWLAHVIGQGNPVKTSPNEWRVPIQGEILENEWIQFKLSIEDEISKTFGEDGWVFHELVSFRIRGSLSISPIILYQIGKP